ncbi:hypothetical protein PsYK624_166190 [Phanerochaete sordida]|uniref:Uncharacterized protein n=1 Tax=Phanerochaete sordida TaxID=48140 RepID=A0A9P3LM14_9APHY|nr:hypothetical protein PsYK624_166190 [Phanerochaete sordida]
MYALPDAVQNSPKVVRNIQQSSCPRGTYPISPLRATFVAPPTKTLDHASPLRPAAYSAQREADAPTKVFLCVTPHSVDSTSVASGTTPSYWSRATEPLWFLAWRCPSDGRFYILQRDGEPNAESIASEDLPPMKTPFVIGELAHQQRQRLQEIAAGTMSTLWCGEGHGEGIRRAGRLSHRTWMQLVFLDAADTGVLPRDVVDKAIGWIGL